MCAGQAVEHGDAIVAASDGPVVEELPQALAVARRAVTHHQHARMGKRTLDRVAQDEEDARVGIEAADMLDALRRKQRVGRREVARHLVGTGVFEQAGVPFVVHGLAPQGGCETQLGDVATRAFMAQHVGEQVGGKPVRGRLLELLVQQATRPPAASYLEVALPMNVQRVEVVRLLYRRHEGAGMARQHPVQPRRGRLLAADADQVRVPQTHHPPLRPAVAGEAETNMKGT